MAAAVNDYFENLLAGLPGTITIEKLDDSHDHILIIGHNPTWTELANHLTGAFIFNLPTCGAAHIELKIETWKQIHENCANLLHFEFPNKDR